ncbi:MAG: dephospho-CoA kinase [Rubrivivax sp.]
MTAPPVATIGLTGGIGSGKSTVAARWVAAGAWLVDTDAIARELTAPGGAALPALVQAFGPTLIGADGALDRDCMRSVAFADAAAKARLEAVLHPLIGAAAADRAALAAGRPVIFDVPLLTESSHWRARVDRVLVVDCPQEVQVRRVLARSSGWDETAVRRVIDQQASRRARRSIADAVIHNGEHTTPDRLASDVLALWSAWIGTG